jgi:peptidoglycan/xylan/chitin deacetylase (PgdA/CDA1 family)
MGDMWPEGFGGAAAFTFDFDAEEAWIAEDPENANRPGVLSQGTYGAKVAVPQILALLDRCGVTATFFVPGRVAERHPARVRAIVDAGHELAHHGYTHTSPTALTREDEEDELVRGLEVLGSFGVSITGYRSPAWDFSAHTLDLLTAHGLAYSSNLMDDIVPYRHETHPIVEVPVQWILDDAAHLWFGAESWTKAIATTATLRAHWEEEFLGIRRLGGVSVFTMHPQVIGRPGRLAFLEEFVRFVTGHADVWVAPTGEIAGRV